MKKISQASAHYCLGHHPTAKEFGSTVSMKPCVVCGEKPTKPAVQSSEEEMKRLDEFMQTDCSYDGSYNDQKNHPHQEWWCCKKCLAKKLTLQDEKIKVLERDYKYAMLLIDGSLDARKKDHNEIVALRKKNEKMQNEQAELVEVLKKYAEISTPKGELAKGLLALFPHSSLSK